MAVELPFLQTLSAEARTAYQITQYMMENPGKTIGQASKWVTGRSWDATRLTNGLAKVSQALAQVGGAGGDFAAVEQVVAHGTQVAAETAAATGGGGVVTRVLTSVGRGALRIIGRNAVASGAVALGTGAVITAVGLGALTYLGANFIGSRMGDASVQPGITKRDASTAVPAVGTGGKYAVFVLTENSGGTIWMGDEAYLKTLRACDTPNGGLCDNPDITYPPVKYIKQSQDFNTLDEAVAYHCSATVQRPGYWGNKAEGYGGVYWSEIACP